MEISEKTQDVNDLEELEIRINLSEDCQDARAKAAVTAFNKWKYQVAKYIRNEFPVFTEVQLRDVVWQTFIDLSKAAEKESFDIEKPLYGLILTIARRRGVDEYRKSKRFVVETDDFIDEAYNRLHGSEIESKWNCITENKKAEEVSQEFCKFVGQLPSSQRIVAKVIADNFPNTLTPAEIAQEVFETTGEFVTAVQIKGRLQALRQKFREILEKSLSN